MHIFTRIILAVALIGPWLAEATMDLEDYKVPEPQRVAKAFVPISCGDAMKVRRSKSVNISMVWIDDGVYQGTNVQLPKYGMPCLFNRFAEMRIHSKENVRQIVFGHDINWGSIDPGPKYEWFWKVELPTNPYLPIKDFGLWSALQPGFIGVEPMSVEVSDVISLPYPANGEGMDGNMGLTIKDKELRLGKALNGKTAKFDLNIWSDETERLFVTLRAVEAEINNTGLVYLIADFSIANDSGEKEPAWVHLYQIH